MGVYALRRFTLDRLSTIPTVIILNLSRCDTAEVTDMLKPSTQTAFSP